MNTEFVNSLHEVTEQSTFDFSSRHNPVNRAELRQFYEGAQATIHPGAIPPYWFEWSRVEVPKSFEDSVANLLDEYSYGGRIGFLPGLEFGPVTEPTVSDFAGRIVVAAALFGEEQTVSLLQSWIDGEPGRFTQMNVLRGVLVAKTLTMCEGVRLIRLPNEHKELAQILPHGVMEGIFGDPDFQGGNGALHGLHFKASLL